VGVDEQEALGQRYAGEPDAGQLAHAALATVGEADRDTVGILFGRGHLAAPDDLTAQLGDPPPKLGLDVRL
jgi:hypothetical protein